MALHKWRLNVEIVVQAHSPGGAETILGEIFDLVEDDITEYHGYRYHGDITDEGLAENG